MEKIGSCLSKVVRKVSVGKYQTTFYHKGGSAYQSSICGGLISLLLITVIGIGIVSQVFDLLLRSNYSLNQSTQRLAYYQADQLKTIHKGQISTCNDCIEVKVKDLSTFGNDLTHWVIFENADQRNCSAVQSTLQFLEEGAETPTNLQTLTFENSDNSEICFLILDSFNLEAVLP